MTLGMEVKAKQSFLHDRWGRGGSILGQICETTFMSHPFSDPLALARFEKSVFVVTKAQISNIILWTKVVN